MADIFISWSSRDREIVQPVIDRMRWHGLDLEEFGADLDAGNISQAVQGYIERARLMVLFVSAASNEAPWLKRETEWAAYRQAEQKRKGMTVLKMIPVLIGDVALDKLNAFLAKNDDQKRLTILPPSPNTVNSAETGDLQPAERLASGQISEAALQNIVLRICDTLDQPKPIVIPAVLLAMTKAEASAHLSDPAEQAKISQLCAAAGMGQFPAAINTLLTRYKVAADDFSPFPDEPPIKKIIESALKPINEGRRQRGHSRLWLWWCRDDLFGPSRPQRDFAIERIGQGSSLVILDSVSAAFPSVINRYNQVSGADARGRQALLWVPPFTIHTSTFQALIEDLLSEPLRLRQEYLRWGTSEREPHLFFDITTANSLRAWLFGALRVIANETAVASAASGSLKSNVPGPSSSPLSIF